MAVCGVIATENNLLIYLYDSSGQAPIIMN